MELLLETICDSDVYVQLLARISANNCGPGVVPHADEMTTKTLLAILGAIAKNKRQSKISFTTKPIIPHY
jgi:hypothetical protein